MNETPGDSIVSKEFDFPVFQTDSSTPSAARVRWPAAWRDAKIGEIQRLGELPPNWDSYGAYPVDPQSIRSAVSRTEALARETAEEPRVSCEPSGNVVLAWESEDDAQACELVFLPNWSISFMVANDNDPSNDIEGTTDNLGHILSLIPGTGVL